MRSAEQIQKRDPVATRHAISLLPRRIGNSCHVLNRVTWVKNEIVKFLVALVTNAKGDWDLLPFRSRATAL